MSPTYQDRRIVIDNERIQVRSFPRTREIALADVLGADLIELGILRYQLVGIGVTRPRTWFTADPRRRRCRHGIELDVGRMLRIGITPDDPEAALAAIRSFARAESDAT